MDHLEPFSQPQQDTIEFTATSKLLTKNENVTVNNPKPSKRYGHLSYIYKSKLYIIGGCSNEAKTPSSNTSDNKAAIYSYSLERQRQSGTDDRKPKKPTQSQQTKWELTQAKFTSAADEQFGLFSFSAHCIFPHKKRLYIFGGCTQEGKTSSHLYRLDLDSLQWSKPQQKGSVPKAREQAFMSLYSKNEKNYLVLYGGANYENFEIFSDINLYQIETKFWFQCHNLSSNFIQPRLTPGVCFNDNKVYIFGGYYLDKDYEKGYFNDLYEVQFNLTIQKGRPYARSHARRLDQLNYSVEQHTVAKPQPRCSSQMLFYKYDFGLSTITNHAKKQNRLSTQWLLICGGQKHCDEKRKSLTLLNDMWFFSLLDMKWRTIQWTSPNQLKSRASFTALLDKDNSTGKIFVFGGLAGVDAAFNDLSVLKINHNVIIHESSIKVQQPNPPIVAHDTSCKFSHSLNTQFIQHICSSITFPYSAIGLIIDNFVNFQAGFCDLTYHISKSKLPSQNYIKFQANADFSMSNEAMLGHFMGLKGGIRTYVQGTDKKIKTEMNKENMTKQIGTNFVIGGLRIGSQLIFINLNSQTYELLIIIVLKVSEHLNGTEDKHQQDSKKVYKLFSFVLSREQLLSEDSFSYVKNSEEARRRRHFFQKTCTEQSRERIRTLIIQGINTIKKGQVKTLFFISKLKTVQLQECTSKTLETQLQLYPSLLHNDLHFGQLSMIKQLESNSVPINLCMDISLKTYMSYLYTQLCETDLTLTINGLERNYIVLQDYLLKVDMLEKAKQIIQISNDFEYECKIIEMYHFAPGIDEKTLNIITAKTGNNFFAHGILFYHKNRLIKRFGTNLGEFLLDYQLKAIEVQFSPQQYQPIILKNSSHYSAAQIFGHLELPQAVPVNLTKTDFVFPAMLEKIQQRLKIMQNDVIRTKNRKIKQKLNKSIQPQNII